MRNHKIQSISIITILAIVALTLGLFRSRFGNRRSQVRYATVKVDHGRIVAKITATGTLSPIVTVQVGSQVSGRLQQIFVDFNSRVKKGDIVARIDPQLFEAATAEARANYVAAQGNLVKAKAQAHDAARHYRRAKTLGEEQLIAQAEVDTAQTNAAAAQAQVDVAKGNVEQAQAALHQAQVNLAYTSIVSPTNGVVIARNVDVGQTVAASLQAPTLFLIAEDLAKMQVDTSVAEADIGKLREGMLTTFIVDAYPNEQFTGTVRQIRNAPQTVQNVVTYDAVIDVNNAELKLRPGMTANVTFVYAERDESLRVANAALRFQPSPALLGGATQVQGAQLGKTCGPTNAECQTVWILVGQTPQAVSLRIGISDGTVSEVVEGKLHAGDLVVTDVAGDGDANREMAGGGPNIFRRVF